MSQFNMHIKSDQIPAKLKFRIAKSCADINFFRKYLSLLMFLAYVFIISSTSLSAQRDTTGTAAKTDSIIQYLTPLEYAFMMHEETRFMLRLPAVGVGAEVEVLPYFTLLAQAQFVSSLDWYYYYIDLVTTAEARWYYGSKKKGIRNMSGNYVSLVYQRQTDIEYVFDGTNSNLFYAKWGVQRRFLGAGLIDLGVSVGYTKNSFPRDYNIKADEWAFVRTTGTIGLGIVFNNEKPLDKDRLCPALKCYERETFLLKINTINLLTVQYSDMHKKSSIWLVPQVGVEQKLFDSPFSIGASLKLNFEWIHTNNDNFYYNETNSEWYSRIQTRYYYNLKNRILKGKSGNGFSANYVSAGISRDYSSESGKLELYNNAVTLTTGIQRTFSDHLYFDVEIGGAVDLRRGEGVSLFGDVQVGIKF